MPENDQEARCLPLFFWKSVSRHFGKCIKTQDKPDFLEKYGYSRGSSEILEISEIGHFWIQNGGKRPWTQTSALLSWNHISGSIRKCIITQGSPDFLDEYGCRKGSSEILKISYIGIFKYKMAENDQEPGCLPLFFWKGFSRPFRKCIKTQDKPYFLGEYGYSRGSSEILKISEIGHLWIQNGGKRPRTQMSTLISLKELLEIFQKIYNMLGDIYFPTGVLLASVLTNKINFYCICSCAQA